jgi:hypothetical protein
MARCPQAREDIRAAQVDAEQRVAEVNTKLRAALLNLEQQAAVTMEVQTKVGAARSPSLPPPHPRRHPAIADGSPASPLRDIRPSSVRHGDVAPPLRV